MPEKNICKFKQVCLHCTKTEEADRPELCVAIRCVELTICDGCKKNKTLHRFGEQKLCKTCINQGRQNMSALKKNIKQEAELRSQNRATLINKDEDGRIRTRITSIVPPGTPPPELNENEIQYYLHRWEEYKGHYRNPAAYFTCHMIIIEEISLSYLNSKILESRGEAELEYNKQRQTAINTLKLLMDQLPEKEAQDLMDDEKAICMIYDAYCGEKKNQYRDGVSRLLSPEAIALAPVLPFQLDPKILLERCGYKTEDIEKAISKLVSSGKCEEMKPEEVLQFFGFKLNEQYALPYDVNVDISPDIEELDENVEYHLG